MTIKNYGLMWEREAVLWSGSKGNAGHLTGMGPTGYAKKNQIEADFREQFGVYILYNEERVMYVGQAGAKNNLYNRLKNHTVDHLADRWNKFSWFGIRIVNTNGELARLQGDLNRNIKSSEILDLLEGLMITTHEPPLNKQGARWKDIDQYYQLKEGWTALSNRQIMIKIANKLENED